MLKESPVFKFIFGEFENPKEYLFTRYQYTPLKGPEAVLRLFVTATISDRRENAPTVNDEADDDDRAPTNNHGSKKHPPRSDEVVGCEYGYW